MGKQKGPSGRELSMYRQIESALNVEIKHMDDNSTNSMYDAKIIYKDGTFGALEVTSWAPKYYLEDYAKAASDPNHGAIFRPHISDLRMIDFVPWLNAEVLSSEGIKKNFPKLAESGLQEQHLALFLYGPEGETFASNIRYEMPDETPVNVPRTCTHLWIPGDLNRMLGWKRGSGWKCYSTRPPTLEERSHYEEAGAPPFPPQQIITRKKTGAPKRKTWSFDKLAYLEYVPKADAE